MQRTYAMMFTVDEAKGLMAGGYRGAYGEGILVVEGLEEQFAHPQGCTFTVSGSAQKATLDNGTPISDKNLASLVFGPMRYTFQATPQEFSGERWHATMTLNLEGNSLNVVIRGTGTGAAWMMVRGVKVTITGTLKS